jgi:predicted PurR-regulated permease PerM
MQRRSKAEPDVTVSPTPIPISKRTRTVLILAVLALLGLVIWFVPSVLTTVVGGFALALALSFPVRWLSQLMPRGLAILLSFLLLVGLVVLAALFLVPLVGDQLTSLANSVPGMANTAELSLRDALGFFQDRRHLPSNPNDVVSRIREDLTNAARAVAGNALGGALNVNTGTFSFALTLFGVIFVGAYLLIDVRRFKAAYLRAAPHHCRRDFLTLWDAFGHSLSKYLGGLALVLAIQGVLWTAGLSSWWTP